MDAITYLKAQTKICKQNTCSECPLCLGGRTCSQVEKDDPEKAIETVEKWLSEHPPVTYASKMREVFPKFVPSGPNCLAAALDKTCSEIKCCDQDGCEACWNREYGSLED
jgi:hypothetical protein